MNFLSSFRVAAGDVESNFKKKRWIFVAVLALEAQHVLPMHISAK